MFFIDSTSFLTFPGKRNPPSEKYLSVCILEESVQFLQFRHFLEALKNQRKKMDFETQSCSFSTPIMSITPSRLYIKYSL